MPLIVISAIASMKQGQISQPLLVAQTEYRGGIFGYTEKSECHGMNITVVFCPCGPGRAACLWDMWSDSRRRNSDWANTVCLPWKTTLSDTDWSMIFPAPLLSRTLMRFEISPPVIYNCSMPAYHVSAYFTTNYHIYERPAVKLKLTRCKIKLVICGGSQLTAYVFTASPGPLKAPSM